MVHLFLDTNIFLHFLFFDEIPWKSFLDGREFKIVIAPIILDELDKHKRNPKQKIAHRAKAILARIEAAVNDPNPGILEVSHKRPSDQTLELYHLDRREQDDLLLASIVEFNATNQECYLVTYDIGPTLRARSVGVKVIRMDDDYLSPSEKTEEELELIKLRRELEALKNTQPKLTFNFDNNAKLLEVQVQAYHETEDVFVKSNLNRERSRLPKLTYLSADERARELAARKAKPTTNLEKLLAMSAFSSEVQKLSREQIDRYNKALDRYFHEFATFLTAKYEYERCQSMSFPLTLLLNNSGSAPADDIDIWLHFPDGFSLMHEDELPKKPKIPEAPYQPKNMLDMGDLPQINPLGFLPITRVREDFELPDLDRPDIRKTNSYEVKIHQKSLKHHQSFKVQPIYVLFDSNETVSSFPIQYRLNVGNLPQPMAGTLNVKVTLNASSAKVL